MASACSEDLPISPIDTTSVTESVNSSGSKSLSRSPSNSSIKEDRWPALIISKESRTGVRRVIKSRDPVMIERSNLVNISKLIVKELIETSLKYGRMLDSDSMPLQHFFIVLEHVLRHGLKPKKGLLGPKKELWDILQFVEKYTIEAQDITSSVRDLPTVRTHMGRARAWLRLALMQKKLADYLKILIDHKEDLLSEYFEPDALMMSDEAIVIMGLLVGLNVIDCNLCVKEEDLDCQQGVIDFSLYLRSSNQCSESSEDDLDHDNMTTVLDQKNYIEELNRHLNATVTNLQAKVETLTTTNALMKEDLAIAKNNILSLYDENTNLKKELGLDVNADRIDEGGGGGETGQTKKSETNSEVEELKVQLENERRQRQETEKELSLQISLKAEMEVAMKLLEKDIHEKQDTIVSLRRQLDDIKLINLEMYKKLQECESSLKHKTELITKLEAKTFAMTDTIQKMDEKYKQCENDRIAAEESSRKLGQQVAEKEVQNSGIEGDLRIEREWRTSLQETVVKDRDKISDLHQELAQLKSVASKYVSLQEEYYQLKEQWMEQEQTLEELGNQLSISKLQVADLKEEATRNVAKVEGQWASDKEVTHCKGCNKEFNITRRRHHCRNCGEIFCNACSDNTMSLPSSAKPVRVCDDCHVFLVGRYSVVQ
ncbi:RUN and FYVE domain-containing protein 2 [Cryptotermes secundus]|uniref:RUN and FYVE domain-containing protein 2 n=1 Tax=Cryptotermes secundus TaxID=105785 RepID=A0A2J7Q478_9NEOP|nr:RUN and FYVE domain-containing protein 2 isoform X2 [Cryptotermes secundus]PNF23375.1 RUN and FYVE domain-containing protein 2 [Cryptotermes secundus]